jgi:RNA polymerase sigma factor FliA
MTMSPDTIYLQSPCGGRTVEATPACDPAVREQPLTEARRTELILEHMPRVRWIAGRIRQKLPATIAFEDLVSAGVLGLIEAVDRYDPAFDVKLKTYAEYRIRGAILDSIRELDGVPAHKRAKVKQMERATGAAEQRLSRAATSDDIAAELGISVNEYHQWVQDTRSVNVGSLGAVFETGTSELMLADVIADREQPKPDDLLQQAELLVLVEQGMETLPAMERTVIDLYFRQGQCLREIAASVNLHVTRISQLKTQATERLRLFIQMRCQTQNGEANA